MLADAVGLIAFGFLALVLVACVVFVGAAVSALRSNATFRIEFKFGRAAFKVIRGRR